MKPPAAVHIENLRKTYGAVVAVDDLSLSVAEGEIFGILGPNGAGKTTTVECVLGLRSPDAGSIRVLGLDPGRTARSLSGGQRQRLLSIALAFVGRPGVAVLDEMTAGKTIRFVPSAAFDDHLLTDLPEVRTVRRNGSRVVVTGTGELVNAVILTLTAAGVTARDVELDSSTLEDAFVKLTGRHLDEEGIPA